MDDPGDVVGPRKERRIEDPASTIMEASDISSHPSDPLPLAMNVSQPSFSTEVVDIPDEVFCNMAIEFMSVESTCSWARVNKRYNELLKDQIFWYNYYCRRVGPAAWFDKCDWRFRCLRASLGGIVWVCGGRGYPNVPQAVYPQHMNDIQTIRCRTISMSPSEGGFFAAIKAGGSLVTWGENYRNMRARSRDDKKLYLPVPANHLLYHSIEDLSIGDGAIAARTSTGEVLRWGDLDDDSQVRLYKLPEKVTAVKQVVCNQRWLLFIAGNGKCYLEKHVTGLESTAECLSDDASLDKEDCEHLRHCVGVALGKDHGIIVTLSGRTYTFGSNEKGQCGLGTKTESSAPSRAKGLENVFVKAVYAGRFVSSVLSEDGQIYATGLNHEQQLGLVKEHARTKFVRTFQKVDQSPMQGSLVSEMSMGDGHFLALTFDGALFVWGINQVGQLGLGGHSQQAVVRPEKHPFVDSYRKVLSICAGGETSAFVVR